MICKSVVWDETPHFWIGGYLLNYFRWDVPESKLLKWSLLLLLTFIPVMLTISDYGVTFDEPIYMEASWHIQKWLSLDSREMFNPIVIDCHWKTDPGRNVHPSGLKWLYIAAQKSIFWEKDPYLQNRTLNVLVFTISLLLFLRWWHGNSFWKGAFFILLLLSIPRFFAHIHFAATDIPMTSLLLVFLVCLHKTLFRKSFWLAGCVLGIFTSIKITSTLLAFPVLLVFLIWHRHEWKVVLPHIIMTCLIGLLVFYALNPDWWFSPLSRCRELLTQSLTRRLWTPFTVYFGGHFYNYRAPFYYPFTMFFITTPLLHILFLFSGLTFFFIDKQLRVNLKKVLVFICLVFPLLLLTLPMSPAHDGVRYLLPSFPFAACFMTLGLEKLWHLVTDHSSFSLIKRAAMWVAAAGAITLLAGDLHNPARYPPFELSYYNKIVGGLSGAHRRGYETTYWFEILNDDVLEQLNEFCAGSTVYLPHTPTDFYFKHMIKDRRIEFRPVQDHQKADFMLIIGRPFVGYWEFRTLPIFRQEGKIPIPVWEISLDSIPLLRLYRIGKFKPEKDVH